MPVSGSGFTNLQQMLDANQGNQLGSAVSSGIGGAASQAQQDLGQQQQAFNLGSQQGNMGSDLNKDANNQYIQNTLQNAGQSGAVTDADAQKFATLRSGQYTGPQDLQNVQQLQGEAQQARQLGQATGTEGGRQGLLQRFVGGAGYNTGQQRLDNMLLSGGADLSRARQSTVALPSLVNNAQAGAQQQAMQAGQQAQAFGQNAQNLSNTAVSGQLDPLQKQLADLTAKQQGTYNQLQSQFGSNPNDITAAQAAQLGITPQYSGHTFGVDPRQYLAQAAAGNLSNVATAQQGASVNALQKLAGQDATKFDPSQYGKQQTVNFASDPFQSAVTAQAGKYQTALYGDPSSYLSKFNAPHSDGEIRSAGDPAWGYLKSGGSLAGALQKAQSEKQEYEMLAKKNGYDVNNSGSGYNTAKRGFDALSQLIGGVNKQYGIAGSNPYNTTMKMQ